MAGSLRSTIVYPLRLKDSFRHRTPSIFTNIKCGNPISVLPTRTHSIFFAKPNTPVSPAKSDFLTSSIGKQPVKHFFHSAKTTGTSTALLQDRCSHRLNHLELCGTKQQQTLVSKSGENSTVSSSFHSSSQIRKDGDDKLKTDLPRPEDERPGFGEQMSLRLINENGFLSWTRNSYLSAAVGATMLNGANEELAQQAGILVLVVSAMNMAWGSGCHVSNLLRIGNRINMSKNTLYLNIVGAVLHAFLWLFTLGYFVRLWGSSQDKGPNKHDKKSQE